MMTGELSVEKSGAVAVLRFSRPASLNAMTPHMESLMRDAIEDAAADSDIRVILLTGRGRAFCAGADLKAVKAGDYYERQEALLKRAMNTQAPYNGRFSYMALCPKPIVAAINGAAVGVGMTLALHCDVRIAGSDATMSFAFSRLGLAAEEGVAFLLPKLIGASDAMDLLLSGRKISARDAREIGLVSLVLPAEGFEAAVLEQIKDLATICSPDAMRRIKLQVWESWLPDYARSIVSAREHSDQTRNAADFAEAVASFAEKRPPRYRGLGS